MSNWQREDRSALIEAQRIQRELVETAGALQLATQRLLALAAELNAQVKNEEQQCDR